MAKKIIIAIDGPSSTGKSTLAKQLAQKLNYIHIDTGAMYRAVGLFSIKKGFFKKDGLDTRQLLSSLKDIHINFQRDAISGLNKIQLNGKEVQKNIRTMEVSENVSFVAKIPEVREKLVNLQQKLGRGRGVVMDGRDIGTVVFPKADLKIFLNAPLPVRADRRYKELCEKNSHLTYEQVLNNLSARDESDVHRKIGPLKKSQDAIEIDNSSLNLKEQLSIILKLAKKTIIDLSE
ncbi:(d)CMP kinase [Bacteroidetes bacterium endosymbiont of Geopemphigus sp.]|uniref:(d)CMP kinase n=1 Tax=Bacteroidetes bacterium endosymbiont of Geopemphigus sp. TaxID=2047937 RepID=UPI000CD31A05|nr:(d)CMP kinase [Bacteroidetes bacterium endosymbiont of Geopemphigus sp.]